MEQDRKYRGVRVIRRKGGGVVWQAYITIKGEHKVLGDWPTEEMAAKTYDAVAKSIGRKGPHNFPD